MRRYLKISFVLFFFLNTISLWATHNRAGEISFIQTGPLTIKATITLYTKTSSVAADRDSIIIFWGDGTNEFLVRANGWGDPQPNDVKISYYIGSHTYPSRAQYTMSMQDPNRIAGILNVNFPDSENIPFYLETTFSFLNPQFQGVNNSVVLLQPPIDIGCVGEVFRHNPNAYDIDGDSISYELIVPLQAENTPVIGYEWPDAINPGTNNKLRFDNKTGDIFWDSPQKAGEYNIAFRVNEYRNGVLITSMIRDMQILIKDNCKSKPPQLLVPEDICVIAGDTVRLLITATDSDSNQKVLINATGQPFTSNYGKAFLENNNIYQNPPVKSLFTWETTCEQIEKTYYQVLFKAMDNSLSANSGLIDLKALRVKISGDSPKNLKALTQNGAIKLTWDYPYPCINSANEYFRGFSVWRKEASNNFKIDTCTPGLKGKGYKIIKYLTNENDAINYYYFDKDIEKGKLYCYRVLAEFAHKTFNGFPYNPVQSLASNESCEFVPDDSPYITKVSVLNTDDSSGSIDINWIKPDLTVFDTIKYPPPYKYQLYRADSLKSEDFTAVSGAEFVFNNYFNQDTMRFIDKNLNTLNIQYKYIVKLLSKNVLQSTSAEASSVFINVNGTDKRIIIDFDLKTPWNNYEYHYYKRNRSTGEFDFIAKGQVREYTDTAVINNKSYCYKVRSFGKLGSNPYVIINDSQIACDSPKDNEKPCPLNLLVSNNCLEAEDKDIDIKNHISWSFPTDCTSKDDVDKYELYFSNTPDSAFQLLYTIDNPDVFDTSHLSVDFAGCYYIVAIDRNGNKSDKSNIVCAEKCPLYQLPNTFTPNGDNYNDIFQPIVKRHISKINLKIYSKAGSLVYSTTDPDINWAGLSSTGKRLRSGTYYYKCDVFSESTKIKTLKGYIELLY